MNKTLLEIIDEVKDGGKPEYDELRYALLVVDSLHTTLNSFVLMSLYGKNKLEKWDKLRYENQYKSCQTAFKADPKKYIGSFDPDLPEYQRDRAIHKKIFDKFMSKHAALKEGDKDETY